MLKYSFWLFGAVLVLSLLSLGCENDPKKIQFQRFYAAGQLFYKQRCANCHGIDGKGIGKLYPPLANSDYLIQDPARTVCIVKNGLQGEIVVNGITYNLPMPPNESLSHLEIAQILTFVYTEWGKQPLLFEEKQVAQILDSCATAATKK